ncbi:MAG: hypothetical protein CVU00_04085 [Bacteroidetes bacterium HGW-Bacteroidetes-17]|jgi:antitoxin component YwqK of YwqJK toxin-antitoxin module|nr:MAG: hypothetical protein CVU00_04085 [Bacteroidetes bacterium HGW-Bacteroidetes-17]
MNKQISIERIYNLDMNSGQTEPKQNLLTKEIFYDAQGNPTKDISYNPPGVVDQTIESKYDDQNRLIEEACFDGEEELLEKTFFEWDAKGKKIKEEKHYLDGSVDTTIFNYDSDGHLIEKLCKNDDDEIEYKEAFKFEGNQLVEYSKYNEDEEIAEKKSFTMNDGKLESEVHWTAEEGNETTKKYRYDEEGNVEKELYYNAKKQLVKKVEYQKYRGRFIEEFIEEDPYQLNTTKLEYDEKNNIILQEQFNQNGEINHRVERTFDQNQRLIETMTYVNAKGQGMNLHFKEVHLYEYYD